MLPEVRMARIIDAIGLHQARKLSCVEAAELLGMSERHFRRLRDAYEAHGAEGIVDRRRGRASGRRAGVDEIEWVIEEFRTRYYRLELHRSQADHCGAWTVFGPLHRPRQPLLLHAHGR